MSNRELVKWAPFSAVIPGSVMVNDVLKKKNKVKMPVLSDDQKNELQDKMITYYNNQEKVNIRYFKAGNIFKIKGIITNIDYNNHKLIINEEIPLFFSQIIAFFE